GYNPDDVLIFDNTGKSVAERNRVDSNAIDVSLKLWIQYNSPATVIPENITTKELYTLSERVMFETGEPVPQYGKQVLYDGRTG
ncbi:MAG: hypothetical protein ACPG7F_10860, partial [Aggregatilineales bacterium]